MPTVVIEQKDYPNIPIHDLKKLINDTEYLQQSDWIKLEGYTQKKWLIVTDSREDGNSIILYYTQKEVESYIRAELSDDYWIEHIYHEGKFYNYDISVSIYPKPETSGYRMDQ